MRYTSSINSSYSNLSHPTPISRSNQTYTAVNSSSGDLCIAIADMEIFKEIDSEYIRMHAHRLESAKAVLVDGNISPGAFTEVAQICVDKKIPLV